MPGRSSVAINVPSRTSVHSGPTAPVFAMADWLIWWLRARLASAPAALACISASLELSIETSGAMPPDSATAVWILAFPNAISLMASAVSLHSCTVASSLPWRPVP